MRGAVWDGEALIVTDQLSVRDPGPGEALVRIQASGICHSDISFMDHGLARPPIVMGHEGAGVIEQLGAGVTGLSVGQPVAVSSMAPCGTCRDCQADRPSQCPECWPAERPTPFSWEGRPTYNFSGISSFAQRIVVKAKQLYKADHIPPEQAALIGCAVSVGAGAARMQGKVRPGDVVAVIGVGGVGVNAMQVARIDGASHLIAIDVNPDKRAVAEGFGADAFIAVDRFDDAQTMRRRVQEVSRPIDVVIDCSGAAQAIEAAIMLPRRGGTTVLVGMTPPGTRIGFDAYEFTLGRTVVSQVAGGMLPGAPFVRVVDDVRSGLIDVASQISNIWPLSEIHDAMGAVRAGKVVRAVLDMR